MQWITLLTDWGLKDHYVAQVKAGIWEEIPDARVIDICHEVPMRDVYTAAYMLSDFIPRCPEGTIHLVGVRDVASAQSPHLLVKINGQYVIGADNGIFSMLTYLMNTQTESVTEIDIIQKTSVLTFATRDVFVRVAAMLAAGRPLSEIGEDGTIGSMVMDGKFLGKHVEQGKDGGITGIRLTGKILFVDGFENVVTNITKEAFDECFRQCPVVSLTLRNQRASDARVVKSYPDVGEADVAMIFLENGLMEVSMRGGRLARLFGLVRNDEVIVWFRPQPEKKIVKA